VAIPGFERSDRSAILQRMTAAEGLPAPLLSGGPGAKQTRPNTLPALCPYLATADGNWRSASPVREHRCMAVSPPVQLAAEKQRRLCLVEGHVNCATYGAALATRSGPTQHSAGSVRPIARMTPVILDRGRVDLRIPPLRADRASGQAILVGVLGLAFVAILLARPAGDTGPSSPLGAGASAPTSPSIATPTGVATPSANAPAETPTPSGNLAPSLGVPSSPPGASAPPVTPGATYRVKSGDTLSAIAARFGTTTRVLIGLNGIADPSRIKIGQILKLP
jgi:FOG: LysM repeat